MSFEDGWAAIHLEMPKRVPRTEYSAAQHWELVKEVTGIDVTVDSPDDVKAQARRAFVGPKGWNYDVHWSTLISSGEFGEMRTSMGHAVYAAGGTDYNDQITCPFKEPEEVLAFDPMEVFGTKDHAELVRRFEEHYKRNSENTPDGVNMTGVYVTCISGLIALFGWDMLLLAAGVDPEAFGALTNRYAAWVQQYFNAIGDADVPVVMVHDDIVWTSGPILRPDWYREYVFPNYEKYLRPMLDSGKKILFTSDGDYTEFIDDIADCGVHGFVMGAHDRHGLHCGEVRQDARLHRQRRHAHPAVGLAGGDPRRGGAVHGPRQAVPRLLHGRGQSHPRQHAGGERPLLRRGLPGAERAVASA